MPHVKDKILSCNCDEGWSGDQLACNIWDQALSGSDPVTDSSRTTSLASTANAKETATVAPADPTFYTLHVDVGTQEILT